MIIIEAINPGEAWKKSVSAVFENGKEIKDGEKKIKELLNVNITIENPRTIDAITKKYGEKKMIQWMKNNFLKLEPVEDWGYSYGQRMQDFQGFNQYENIIKKLQNNLTTKSATISFMYPPDDKKHVPCIVAIDLKIRQKMLIGTAFFRSQDAGKKLYADIICIGEIMNRIAKKINVKTGLLNLHVVSLHIYQEDFPELKKKFCI